MDFLNKFFYIIGQDKKKLVYTSFLFLLVGLLDFLSISLVIPLISTILDPEKMKNLPAYQYITGFLDIGNYQQFALFLIILILIAFLIRNILYFISNIYISKIAFFQKVNLTNKLLSAYLYLPYEWHMNKNSSRIIQNIIEETSLFCQAVMIPFSQIMGESIILLLLLILVLMQNIFFTIGLITFVVIIFGSYYLYSKRVSPQLGENISRSNENIIKNVTQGINSIKETKVLGCEEKFRNEVSREATNFASSKVQLRKLNISPKIIIELAILTYVFGWLISYLILGLDLKSLLPLMTVVALGGLRLLPFVQRMMMSINGFQRSKYFINKLYKDLKDLENLNEAKPKYDKKIDFDKQIFLKDIFYSYPCTEDYALRGISLTVNKNDVIGVTGETGSGKTTLVNILLGITEPSHGEIYIDDKSYSTKSLRSIMGYIPQDIYLLDDSIKNNVAFGIDEKNIDINKVKKALKSAQIYDFVSSLKDGMNTKVGENGVRLSGGQKQRLAIARALYHERKVLVFDEATSSLDYNTEKKIQESIRSLEGDKTIILIAHRLRTLKDCNKVYVLKDGEVIKEGDHNNIIKSYETE